MIQDTSGAGYGALEGATFAMMGAAAQAPDQVNQVFSTYNTGSPRIEADVDRDKALMLGVQPSAVFDTLGVYLGSSYVNDFNYLGRTFRVTAQAEPTARDDIADIANLKTRSDSGAMVPIGSVANLRDDSGPSRIVRYNLYPASELQGQPAAGVSSGQALDIMEPDPAAGLLLRMDRAGAAAEGRGIGRDPDLHDGRGVRLPGAGRSIRGLHPADGGHPDRADVSSGGHAGRQHPGPGQQHTGPDRPGGSDRPGGQERHPDRGVRPAGRGGGHEPLRCGRVRRQRPILMTSFAFILGVVPLMLASGPGAEMRQALGTSVFSGMLGVTFFGLLFTPVFYVVMRWVSGKLPASHKPTPKAEPVRYDQPSDLTDPDAPAPATGLGGDIR
jgi:hypothetical protein